MKFGLAAAAALPLSQIPLSSASAALAQASAVPLNGGSERRLSLFNINTRESFDGVYWANGGYRVDALRQLDVLLRDHHVGQVCRYDAHLFDILWQLADRTGAQEPFKVICGYRSSRTNAAARSSHRGVARESFHLHGMAVDVNLPGASVHGLAQEAMAIGAGGVGTYVRSGFVHVDTGPVRHW